MVELTAENAAYKINEDFPTEPDELCEMPFPPRIPFYPHPTPLHLGKSKGDKYKK